MTLVVMTRTMLDEHSTPRRYWSKALATIYNVVNSVFLRLSLGKICYQLRFGRKSSVSHFGVFGAKCFIHKTRNLDKFESRIYDVIFLGYPTHSRGFVVLNVETNIIMDICNVTFDGTNPGARLDISRDS